MILTVGAVNASQDLNCDNSTQSISSGNEVDNLTLVENEDSDNLQIIDRELDNSEILSGDDVSSFQQKVADTPSGGLLVLDKNYDFDSFSITISKPITIDGAGHRLHARTISDDYLINVSAENVVLKNIDFYDISSSKGIVGWFGVNGKLDSCTFSNNNIFGPTYYKVGHIVQDSIVWAGFNGTISNSKFLNNGRDTLVHLYASKMNITNCDFENNNNLHAIVTSSNINNCIIGNCTFNSCNSSQGVIYNNANRSIIKNCRFMDNIGIAVYLHDYYNEYTVEARNRTSGYNSQIIGSMFVNNNDNIIACNAKSCSITDSIILKSPNTRADLIRLINADEFSANYNWWGNTLNNKFIKPFNKIGVEVNHWLFLNDTYYMENCPDNYIKSSFYDCYLNENGDKIIGKYFSSDLPDTTLEYSTNNNTIDRFILKLDGYTRKYEFDTHKTVIAGTFTELNNLIRYGGSSVNLKQNYTFNKYVDYDLVDGIDVFGIHIWGNGFTIDGSNQARIFNAHTYAVFYDFNFINAYSDNGGAIIGTSNLSFRVINSNFTDNHASISGGAIYNGHAVNCTFINNTAGCGGAIYIGAAENSTFENNRANNAGAGYDMHAINSTFVANHASDSYGAMYKNSAENCTFIGNTAGNNAGAFGFGYAVNCTFIDNHADNGGAIYEGLSALKCNFINNSAGEYGGALYGTYANYCNFRLNSAKFGGAISSKSSASNSTFVNNTAEVSGANKFDSYVFNCTYDGKLPRYTLYSPDFTAVEGFGGNLNVKMYDSPKYYLKGEKITVNIYDGSNKLIRNYSGQTGYNIFVDLPQGQYTAVISGGNDGLDVNSINITMTVKKSTFIYGENVNAVYNVEKILIITLHGPNNRILDNESLSVTLNGVTKIYITDDNGQIKISSKALVPQTYKATIKFAGNSEYAKSTKTVTVKVNKATPKLTAKEKTFKKSVKTKKYTVTLKTNLNKVMKNTKLTLKVNGKTYSAKTNAKGQATFKITKLTKKGKFTAVVKYAGSKYYNAKTVKAKITVK